MLKVTLNFLLILKRNQYKNVLKQIDNDPDP